MAVCVIAFAAAVAGCHRNSGPRFNKNPDEFKEFVVSDFTEAVRAVNPDWFIRAFENWNCTGGASDHVLKVTVDEHWHRLRPEQRFSVMVAYKQYWSEYESPNRPLAAGVRFYRGEGQLVGRYDSGKGEKPVVLYAKEESAAGHSLSVPEKEERAVPEEGIWP